MKNTFIDLVFNPMCRTSEVNRYSGIYQQNVENLAEHITDIMMLSYMIGNKLNDFGEGIDLGILLEKCLLHDVEEVILGDIPRTTKYASDGIKKEIDVLSKKSASKLLNIRQYQLWSESKEGKEGSILKLADFLVVAKKCCVEIDLRCNYSFLPVLENVLTLFQEDNSFPSMKQNASREYLHDLWQSCAENLAKLYSNHQDKVKHYKLNGVRGEL